MPVQSKEATGATGRPRGFFFFCLWAAKLSPSEYRPGFEAVILMKTTTKPTSRPEPFVMPDQPNPAEQFTQFWTDFMSSAGSTAGSDNGAAAFSDSSKQMQRMFFDAMASYADDFMRSEQFLNTMKQSMEQSIKFKKLMDEFLTKAHHGVQSPAREDVEDIAGLLRGFEKRVLQRLDELEARVAAVEDSTDGRRAGSASRARPKAAATRKKASKPKTASRRKTARKKR